MSEDRLAKSDYEPVPDEDVARHPLARYLRRWVLIKEGEVLAVVLCTLYHFFVQGGWNILKPIRDEMSIQGGIKNIEWMYTATMVGTLVVIPIFAWLTARTSRRVFIPLTYLFIGSSFVALFVALMAAEGEVKVWLARAFFVWASVFNMFLFALFWGFMADIWSSAQSKRLFGFVGFGGTAGVLGGSFLTGNYAQKLGLMTLVGAFAIMMGLAIVIVIVLTNMFHLRAEEARRARIGPREHADTGEPSRDVFAGFKLITKSPYLMGIMFAVVAHTLLGSYIWIMRTEIAAQELATSEERVEFFASITLYANIITIVIQTLFFGWISRLLGLGLMLAVVPIVALIGFGLIEVLPAIGFSALAVVFWVQVLRRGLHYAISKPAREILYTVLSADEKYKSKVFIDTFIYRSGDTIGAWTLQAMRAMGASVTVIAMPVASIWVVISLLLGRQQVRLAKSQESPVSES